MTLFVALPGESLAETIPFVMMFEEQHDTIYNPVGSVKGYPITKRSDFAPFFECYDNYQIHLRTEKRQRNKMLQIEYDKQKQAQKNRDDCRQKLHSQERFRFEKLPNIHSLKRQMENLHAAIINPRSTPKIWILTDIENARWAEMLSQLICRQQIKTEQGYNFCEIEVVVFDFKQIPMTIPDSVEYVIFFVDSQLKTSILDQVFLNCVQFEKGHLFFSQGFKSEGFLLATVSASHFPENLNIFRKTNHFFIDELLDKYRQNAPCAKSAIMRRMLCYINRNDTKCPNVAEVMRAPPLFPNIDVNCAKCVANVFDVLIVKCGHTVCLSCLDEDNDDEMRYKCPVPSCEQKYHTKNDHIAWFSQIMFVTA